MSLLTRLRRQSAADKQLQRRFVRHAETIADVASVNQAALTEIASLHAYAAQKVTQALALASALGVNREDREDRRRFWLTWYLEHTRKVVEEAQEEMGQTLKFYARLTGDIVRWNLS